MKLMADGVKEASMMFGSMAIARNKKKSSNQSSTYEAARSVSTACKQDSGDKSSSLHDDKELCRQTEV